MASRGKRSTRSPERAEALSYCGGFSAALFTYPGKGGWTFVPIPPRLAPPVTHGWGRTPVRATVDGHTWDTSVWRERSGRVLLAVPKAIRRAKGHGDRVRVHIAFRAL